MAETGSRSKTPYDRNSSSKLHSGHTFFIDRALGKKKVANALRAIGISAEIHDDHFASDAEDRQWLPAVGERGWVVLTKDRRIRHRPLEKEALINAKVAAFVLTGGNLTGDEMATIIVRAMPKIQRLLSQQERPFIARITRGGTVSVLFRSKRPRRGSE